MEKEKILLIDDEKEVLKKIKWALADNLDVISADRTEDAIAKLRSEKPRIVTLDMDLAIDESTGPEELPVLEEMTRIDPHLKVIVIAADSQREVAVRAIQRGAFDYSCKPVDVNELRLIIQRAVHTRKLEEENEILHSRLEDVFTFDNIIGSSPEMENVFTMIRKVADTDINLLVHGEGGTGKELVAKSVHYRSSRRRGPFIIVNCGAIPEDMLESELFGHERGAFTGAHVQRRGKFELAHGGTIFLDEIGETPVQLQVKLLRFLHDRKIERLGGRKPIELDVRVVAATHRDLQKMMISGAMREDLYFLLSVIVINVPPLRDRGDDVVLLAKEFLRRFAHEMNKGIEDFTREAIQTMRSYSWPGNVRELENRVKRGVIISQGPTVNSHDMGIEGDGAGLPLSLKEARRELDIRYIRRALRKMGGNISKASVELGISRVCLHDLLKKYSLR